MPMSTGIKTKTFALILRPGPRWNPAKPTREQALWDEHARFVDGLFERGVILQAGPFADGSGALVIVTADSLEAARALYRDDPWAKAEILLTAEVKEWTIFLDRVSSP